MPQDLIPAIKHLRKTFEDQQWQYGWVTQKLCYWQLHPGAPEDAIKEYLQPLQQLKSIAGMAPSKSFAELIRLNTAPAIFKAYFDLYLEATSVTGRAIFHHLVAVGRANEQRLAKPYIEWAEEQTKNLIRSNIHLIPNWVRDVCDTQPYTPDDMEEQIWWRKWEAPLLLIMKPSRNMPYDLSRIWERRDAKDSASLLEAFAAHYVLHVEIKIEKDAGEAAVELAQQPRPRPVSNIVQHTAQPAQREEKPTTPKLTPREIRAIETQAKHRSWQEEYRRLKESHPGRSDVWYSRKISRMESGSGNSPDTIRKHMTEK